MAIFSVSPGVSEIKLTIVWRHRFKRFSELVETLPFPLLLIPILYLGNLDYIPGSNGVSTFDGLG